MLQGRWVRPLGYALIVVALFVALPAVSPGRGSTRPGPPGDTPAVSHVFAHLVFLGEGDAANPVLLMLARLLLLAGVALLVLAWLDRRRRR